MAIGRFGFLWLQSVITLSTIAVFILILVHLYEVIKSPEAVSTLLAQIYQELKLFVTKYQSVIAFIAALIFGDTLKGKNANKKDSRAKQE